MSSDALSPNNTGGTGRKPRTPAATAGLIFLVLMAAVCLGTLPWMLRSEPGQATARYNAGAAREGRLPPSWWPARPAEAARIAALVDDQTIRTIAQARSMTPDQVRSQSEGPVAEELQRASPLGRAPVRYGLGTDALGRSLLYRCLTGGGISLTVGLLAALLSVVIGTVYGTVAGYAGGRVDAVMMRIVDILYGLPYVLLVVLLAVAADSALDRVMAARVESAAKARAAFVDAQLATVPVERRDSPALRRALDDEALARFGSGEISLAAQNAVNLVTLLVAIGGVSWLTMARVVRGQVLSLKNQPFVEAARAVGATGHRIFARHLLPNLVGPIVVYATLTVPQAILQESFLSFLGIGVKPPLPSWGNLASEGLTELNPYQSNWWLLLFPCLLLSATLLALNFVGEGLRESLDPRRART